MNRKFVALAISLMLCVALLAACGSRADTTVADAPAEAGLTLALSDLTSQPAFVDWTQDGTAMQLIAMKDEKGNPRLAFNTCQSCGGSPYAWFEDLGDGHLQCQNCGLTFPLDTVGTTKAAGCNPVTITDYTVDGDSVTVPESLLKANVERFSNWKKFD